jgi:hypothetical protein
MEAPGLAGEASLDHRCEFLERHRVVGGIEGGLVVFGAELDAELEGGVAAMLLAPVPVEGGRKFDKMTSVKGKSSLDHKLRSRCTPLPRLRSRLRILLSATAAMVVMEPALGIMKVAPLPALNRRFTSYRLDMVAASDAQPPAARAP